MTGKSHTKSILSICDDVLEVNPENRDEYIVRMCGENTKLRASVLSVLRAVDSAGEFLETDDGSAEQRGNLIGETIGGFKVIEKLGEGGMGSVYLAERATEDFTQQVAIKFVRGRIAGKELIERFTAERKILAGLNHPYIAALIDGGTTSDGIPYLVMEFIEGQPIDRFCDQHELDIAHRISLIQKVAMAVQSAHQNLVVHRDLKPSNVLITPDAIPKLLDFGIAKLMPTEGSTEKGNTTLFGHQAMTPDYASPEQILENHVTTASDVYSLGVLTYQILAGERPYHIQNSSHRALIQSIEGLSVPKASTRLDTVKSAEVIATVANNRSTTPQKLKKLLAGDLDNILSKALHREADRRYTSVSAFSEDMQRYLDGMPVEARPDTVGYRASRFVSRHRVGFAASIALAVALMAGLAGTTWAYLQAEDARADANIRFTQVREIANTMMFDVYEQIEKVPGTNSALEILAETAQKYLETLVSSDSAPPELKFEAATGYSRLSSIMNTQVVSNTDNRDTAQQAWDKSLALLTELTTSYPDRAAVYEALGELHTSRAQDFLYVDNLLVESRKQLDLAATAFEQAEQAAPDNDGIVAKRLTARRFYADSYRWQTEHLETAQLIEQLLANIEIELEKWPESTAILKTQADVYQLSGRNHWFLDTFEEGVEQYSKAVVLYERVLALDGPDQSIDEHIADTRWSRGNSLFDLGRPEESAIDYAAAIELIAVQAARDPNDAVTGRRLAILRASQAAVIVKLGQPDEALRLMNETNDWFEAQVAADPETPDVHRSLGVSYMMMANIMLDADRKQDACHWYKRTREKWLDIDQRFGLAEFDADQPERLLEILQEEGC